MIEMFDAPIEDIIRKRISVRTYSGEVLSHDLIKRIREEISSLSNPFGVRVNFRLLTTDGAVDPTLDSTLDSILDPTLEPILNTTLNPARLGTYGIIKGAQNYIGATVKDEGTALEALGYEFEKLILRLTALGLGTCWMGGTFKRSRFAAAMKVNEGELFPIISPFGYPSNKKSLQDSLVRFAAKGDKRKSRDLLFFNGSPDHPLSVADAGAYETPLEMVRLAPSASNKQPWRIIKQGKHYHFFMARTPGYGQALGFDIQSIDMGIAMCHFHLTAMEKGLFGRFEKIADPPVYPLEWEYHFTWISE